MEDMLDEITEHAPDGKKVEERNEFQRACCQFVVAHKKFSKLDLSVRIPTCPPGRGPMVRTLAGAGSTLGGEKAVGTVLCGIRDRQDGATLFGVPRLLDPGRKSQTERLNAASIGENMCNIGKPVEIIEVEPLSLPTPLRRETEQATEQPVTVEVPVSAETPITAEKP